MNKEQITAHCVIRNEDVWIWYVIQSVLPFFDKIIITDTGSEDHTLEILDTIKSDKIQLIHKPKLMGADFQAKFNEYRNEQIDMTTTPWWFLLDGDEIFNICVDSFRKARKNNIGCGLGGAISTGSLPFVAKLNEEKSRCSLLCF